MSPKTLDIFLSYIEKGFSQLMNDIYGNYFCQKLIQNCSSEQRVLILKAIYPFFYEISCNTSGTHSLQSLIEISNMTEEEDIIKAGVENNFNRLTLHFNGTHVVQKVVTCLNEASRMNINLLILNNFDKLIYDSNGICILKKFVKGNDDLELRKQFVEKVKIICLEIVQNPFGNYIVQYMLDEWGVEYCKDVYHIIAQNILSLSMQKFSSNVVEKCLEYIHEVSYKL